MDINAWHNETLGNKVVESLKKNAFDALYFEKGEEALEYISAHISKDTKVAFGGSMTIKALKVKEKAEEKGAIILDHGDAKLSGDEKLKVMREELTSDLFLCSSNAVTLDGELINIDGAGNRVAAITFGPKKVILVVGINKICKDENEGFNRLKLIACPKNNMRLNKPNPCTKTGVCMDCKSDSRICRVYSVIKRKPMCSDITVIIVGESLGY